MSADAPPLRRTYWVLGGIVAVGLVAGVIAVVATYDPEVSRNTLGLLENSLAKALMAAGAAVGVVGVLATAIWWAARFATARTRPIAAGG